MTRRDLEFVTFDDFSPGIFTNTRYQGGRGSVLALGAATEQNTYKCLPTPNGSLGPAPKRTLDITLPDLDSWASNLQYFITGFNAEVGYVFAASGATTNTDDRVEIHFTAVYQSGTDYVVRWYRYRIYDTTPTLETIHSATISSADVAEGLRYVPFTNTRMNPSTPTDFGNIVTVASWVGTPETGARWCKAFPDPSSASTNSVIDVGDTTHDYTRSYGHQGRILLARFIRYNRGVDTTRSIGDNWYWTATNDNELSSATATPFVLENPQGHVDAFSTSANELFIVKSFGGGILIRGSLDNPTIIQLPNIHSSDGVQNTFKGCMSALGPIYCGPDGAYLWEGGDKDVKISPQLDGDFFHTDTSVTGADGQCSRWQDKVLFPNNWLFDTNTRSWWRLENPTDVNVIWWSASAYRGQLYGSGDEIDNSAGAATKQVMWRWSFDTPVEEYSWQSQPLPNVTNQLMKVREVVLTFQGATQDIAVAIVDETETTLATAEFDAVNSPNTFTRVRTPVTAEGKHLYIRITCDGTANSNPAAVIQSLSLGMESSTHMANA